MLQESRPISLPGACQSCGACCMASVVPPFDADELDALDPVLSSPIIAVRDHRMNPDVAFWDQTGTRVCSWFNETNGTCEHYNQRPKVCRDFKVGGDDCIRTAAARFTVLGRSI